MPTRFPLQALAGLTLVALIASGCSDGSSDSEETSSPEPTPSDTQTTGDTDSGTSGPLGEFYGQQLEWEECSQGECAVATVPVDYQSPDGQTTEIHLARRPADDQDRKLGSLFLNPGGPGGSGIEMLGMVESASSEKILRRYDLVGFDPRGVGASDPVDCLSDKQLDNWLATDPDPDTPGELRKVLNSTQTTAQGCKEDAGALVEHMSTTEVAKDLDVLREVVGDDQLNYYGASYGTFIGSSYAELFPKRVGRMILDGAIDPTLTPKESSLGQVRGFQVALRAYVEDCVRQDDCPLGNDADAGMRKVANLLDQIEEEPLTTADEDRPLTRGLAFYGLIMPLYGKQNWPYLTDALRAAFDGNGSQLLTFADLYARRTGDGTYESNQLEAQIAVNCLDGPTNVTIPDVQNQITDEFEAASPIFGSVMAWGQLGCSEWPFKPAQKPLDIDGSGAEPIVVVGTTRDPATPYRQAKALANQLDSGVLLTREGDGHTGYHMGNQCIDDAVDTYLLTGNPPEDGKRC